MNPVRLFSTLIVLICIIALVTPSIVAATGDDSPPEGTFYVILDSEGGSYADGVLTLTGVAPEMLSLAPDPLYASRIATDTLLVNWAQAGESVPPLAAMLELGDMTVAVDVVALTYETGTAAFVATVGPVFVLGEEDAKVDMPATFGVVHLVLPMTPDWLNVLNEQAAMGVRGDCPQTCLLYYLTLFFVRFGICWDPVCEPCYCR